MCRNRDRKVSLPQRSDGRRDRGTEGRREGRASVPVSGVSARSNEYEYECECEYHVCVAHSN